MIRYVDELIEELNKNNLTPSMEVRVNKIAPIASVEVNGEYVDIYVQPSILTDELEDKISGLESDLEDSESDLNDCRDALESVCDSIDEIKDHIAEYERFHPEEWKVLGQLSEDSLEEFVKIAINWYNIEKEVRNADPYR